ncbi:MAG: calcium/sodium antiporter [Candidatus Omnitrophica bacterium]|nr:calcium/sodium antiporter [Candidatus Omnitrophota bacterium]
MSQLSINIFLFLAGLGLLILSSDWLIQSSVKLSFMYRLSPLFIGAVLIAFGTSAPEAGVSIMASIRDQNDIALGNIIGSNIANIGLIVGLCAMLRPFRVSKSMFKRELPLMLLAVLLLFLLSLDKFISRIDGIMFLVLFLFFCIFAYKGARKEFDHNEMSDFTLSKVLKKINSPAAAFFIILLCLIGVIFAADVMVRSGSAIAEIFGVKPWIIGLTIFALGTSLPELVTSLNAVFKKAPTISIGNIVGSNIFNILFVLGIAALIRPIAISPSLLKFELPLLLIFSFALFTVMLTGFTIKRWEGLLLFVGYLFFLALLFTS